MRVGVLALQGDFREHRRALELLGVEVQWVRLPEDLDGLDGLILPGGESTTIGTLAELHELVEPLRRSVVAGLPTFGTCAGMILLASGVAIGAQPQLGVLDAIVERNAYGRQNESFETDLEVTGLDEPFHAVFIRAPHILKLGSEVEVLAEWENRPVMVRQGNVLATAFHPELTPDPRIHRMLLDAIAGRARGRNERGEG